VARAHAILLACSLAPVFGGGCGDDFRDFDASTPYDAGVHDEGAGVDGGIPVGAVFTIVGCDHLSFDAGAHAICTTTRGRPLSFVPLAAGVDAVMWMFPSANPSSSTLLTPEASWPSAGTFTVTLTAGGGGGAAIGTGQVHVVLGGAGATCNLDADCDGAAGYTCLCGDGAACPAALSAGLCVRHCEATSCAVGEVCVDLTRGGSGTSDGGVGDGGAGDPYRAHLCLPACMSDATCRTGLACLELPTATSGSSFAWARACFASVLGGVGAPCLTDAGVPDGSRCLSGHCEVLGARGMCTLACDSSDPCPDSAVCSTMPSVGPRCLPRCAGTTCDDPLLACQGAGAGGLGFSLPIWEPPDTKLCAPKRCATSAECAPAGTCASVGGGLFCVR
jgi:hypothetical protein